MFNRNGCVRRCRRCARRRKAGRVRPPAALDLQQSGLGGPSAAGGRGPGAAGRLSVAAGARDIRIPGGADVIQQYLRLGVVDELEIALVPILFGSGRRLLI